MAAHKVGDIVESVQSGHLHKVTERWRDPADRRQYAYGTVSCVDGLPNAFHRHEIRATVCPEWMAHGVEIG